MVRPFRLIDVFGTGSFTGNPVAVIADAEGLSSEEMQQITRWLNLSETTFLLPPTVADADYHVRIFTLAHELPFAGHPTLGTCHAWLEAGGRPKRANEIVQECGAGLVKVRRDGDRLAFAAPAILRSGEPSEAEIAAAVELLQIDRHAVMDAQWVDNGPGWLGIMLASAEAVLAVEPMRHFTQRIDVGIVGPYAPGSEADFEVRALFTAPGGSIIEDPVTGSLNASLGQWLFATGRAHGRYLASQGTRLGRKGRVDVRQDEGGQVWVAGQTKTLFSGHS